MKKELAVNYAIEADPVRVIDSDGNQIGILPLAEAVAKAESMGLDLVLMSPTANPPVCKIMDYGKYKYQVSKKANLAKKRQHSVQVKEIKVGASTDPHDLQVKLKRVRQFLSDGNKVKLTVHFRGRELMYAERGLEQLKRIAADVKDLGKIEVQPKLEGRQMMMVIAPLKK